MVKQTSNNYIKNEIPINNTTLHLYNSLKHFLLFQSGFQILHSKGILIIIWHLNQLKTKKRRFFRQDTNFWSFLPL